MAREVPVAGVGRFRGFRNGRKMWDLLPLWQEAEDRRTARSGKPERPQRAEERSNMERRYFIGHSSRRASPRSLPALTGIQRSERATEPGSLPPDKH